MADICMRPSRKKKVEYPCSKPTRGILVTELVILSLGQEKRMTLNLRPPLRTSKLCQRKDLRFRFNLHQTLYTVGFQGHQDSNSRLAADDFPTLTIAAMKDY
ncbi:hypothetical protein TNCV_4867441 [Trichonephila clavipes]|nr:hypothetical protein TNCV_4867441 [Trichonephila clavipes]